MTRELTTEELDKLIELSVKGINNISFNQVTLNINLICEISQRKGLLPLFKFSRWCYAPRCRWELAYRYSISYLKGSIYILKLI